MAQEIEITIEEGEYEIAGDGSITVTIDPSDYDLIDADDAEDAIDVDEFLSGLDDDTLIKELKKRELTFHQETAIEHVQHLLDKSTYSARVTICDLLRISHHATIEEIASEIEKLI